MSAPLSAGQLAELRRREESTMTDTADIVSYERVSDDAGGSLVTPATQSNVPCRRSPSLANSGEVPFGGQLASGLQWRFAFPYGTAVTSDDEIVYGSERFAVMGVLGPRTPELCRRIIAVEKSNA